jgi:hypothetical protein
VADEEEEDSDCEPGERIIGDEDFLVGTGIGRVMAMGLTAVGETEP